MLAIVAVASAAGSASLRSQPRAFMLREAVTEVGFVALEAGGDRCSGVRVVLGELAYEAANWAAAARLQVDLILDEYVEPAVDTGPRVQVV